MQRNMTTAVEEFINEGAGPAEQMIRSLVDCEHSYINTDHPSFIGGTEALATVMRRRHPGPSAEEPPEDLLPDALEHEPVHSRSPGNPSFRARQPPFRHQGHVFALGADCTHALHHTTKHVAHIGMAALSWPSAPSGRAPALKKLVRAVQPCCQVKLNLIIGPARDASDLTFLSMTQPWEVHA